MTYSKLDIEKVVDRLLEVALGDIYVLPVDIRSIFHKLGYTVRDYIPTNKKDIGKISGLISFDKKALLLNKYDSDQRKSFTAAHELGHVSLHAKKGFDVIYRKENLYDSVDVNTEREANYFAACVLMPKYLFIHYCKIFNGDFYKLAKKFNVSNEDSIERIEQLRTHLAYSF